MFAFVVHWIISMRGSDRASSVVELLRLFLYVVKTVGLFYFWSVCLIVYFAHFNYDLALLLGAVFWVHKLVRWVIFTRNWYIRFWLRRQTLKINWLKAGFRRFFRDSFGVWLIFNAMFLLHFWNPRVHFLICDVNARRALLVKKLDCFHVVFSHSFWVAADAIIAIDFQQVIFALMSRV